MGIFSVRAGGVFPQLLLVSVVWSRLLFWGELARVPCYYGQSGQVRQ